jgi:CheY-like chemotaxis protein
MVDDDDMMRILFRDTFWIHSQADRTYDVTAVRSIPEAEAHLAQAPVCPDVIFMGLWLLTTHADHTTSRESQPTLDFIKRLKQNPTYSHMIIVIYSRFSEAEFKEKAKQAGADHYLVKGELTPLEMVEFVEKL